MRKTVSARLVNGWIYEGYLFVPRWRAGAFLRHSMAVTNIVGVAFVCGVAGELMRQPLSERAER